MQRFLKSIILLFSFILLTFSINIVYSTNPLTMDQAKAKIDPMLISNEYHYEVIKISEPVNNLCAVAITPPCREFPNIIIFNFDPDTGDYTRVLEGLCLGIQDKPSGKVDLHTLGLGMDMAINDGSNEFNSETIQGMIDISDKSGMVVVPYPYFRHMHIMGEESYTIDKTGFNDFAVKLLGNAYKKYPKGSCLMYDMPNLADMQFTFENEKYVITGMTDNKQLWKVSFDRMDTWNKSLVNKKIEVKKI